MGKAVDRILGGIMGVLSLLCLTGSYQLWEGWAGPGTMPLIVGTILLFLAVGFWVFPSRDPVKILPSEKKMLIPMGVTLGSFALYILLVGRLGYPLATWLLLTVLVRSMKSGSLYKTFLWTGIVAVGSYIVFKFYLSMSLPAGFIGM